MGNCQAHPKVFENDQFATWTQMACTAICSLSLNDLGPVWFRHDSVFITHNSNSNLITHNPNPTITQRFQNYCLVTKLNHISQLLSPLFAKMVEPTPLTLHKGYGCYPHQFSLPFFHILLSPLPPSMANSKPTTVNTTNGHKTKK